jgi:hypothetical protein
LIKDTGPNVIADSIQLIAGRTAQGGIKGTSYFSPVAITCSGVIDAADAKNPAREAGWICLSCDQPRKWSRDYLS